MWGNADGPEEDGSPLGEDRDGLCEDTGFGDDWSGLDEDGASEGEDGCGLE